MKLKIASLALCAAMAAPAAMADTPIQLSV